jgi:hypothetical protein
MINVESIEEGIEANAIANRLRKYKNDQKRAVTVSNQLAESGRGGGSVLGVTVNMLMCKGEHICRSTGQTSICYISTGQVLKVAIIYLH